MRTVQELIRLTFEPEKACWILWEGHRVCLFSLWLDALGKKTAYVLSPDYKKWEISGAPDIPGLDMELRIQDFTRIDSIPAFYYVRCIPTTRDDWDTWADMYGVSKGPDRSSWDLMIAAEGRTTTDKFLVESCDIEYVYRRYGLRYGEIS